MAAIFEAQSTLTDRYQTTVPEPVRRALNLGKRDKIVYSIRGADEVVISRAADAGEEGDILSAFLEFLARDLATNPASIMPISANLPSALAALTQGVEVDLEAPLPADDE